jgi:hypothetical protein
MPTEGQLCVKFFLTPPFSPRILVVSQDDRRCRNWSIVDKDAIEKRSHLDLRKALD